MGISRDSQHKHRHTGGARKLIRAKRKFEIGRPAAMTGIGEKRVRTVRGRGGNLKFRALRLDSGNFSWPTESVTRKSRILSVVYNASNNELVRTNTLVKGCIVEVDASPFRQWFETHYGVQMTKQGVKIVPHITDAKDKPAAAATPAAADAKPAAKEGKKGTSVPKTERVRRHRRRDMILDAAVEDQIKTGRLYAAISSRPGQVGRADGYILEGDELRFYLKKMDKSKKGGKKE